MPNPPQPTEASRRQPTPITAPHSRPARAILDALLDEREAIGISQYGQPLMTFDGRDTDKDINDELLDALQYMAKKTGEAYAAGFTACLAYFRAVRQQTTNKFGQKALDQGIETAERILEGEG